MNPCFVCGTPTASVRFNTKATAHPATPEDAVSICLLCDEDWTAALIAIAEVESTRRKH
jgi:hypothetical protein